MPGAPTTTTINGQIGAVGGLEGTTVPASIAAISKAGTGAYLSSQGNAFSTRTASQIVQEHFDPGEGDAPAGPLFGVQFSQLPCGDIVRLAGGAGPHALPLGLSADPGGIPLYKQGDLVGGVGVEFDGLYTLDRDIRDVDNAPEERIALAASLGFEAPSQRVGPTISVAGRDLRYTDLTYADLDPLPNPLPALDGTFLKIAGFSDGVVHGGTIFGSLRIWHRAHDTRGIAVNDSYEWRRRSFSDT